MTSSHDHHEVLFIVLADELIGIDFKRLLCQHQWNHKVKDQPNVTPIYFRKSLLEYFKKNKEMVVGFTHMKLGSEVYLLGGEKLKSGTKLDKMYVYNNPQCHGGFSRKVFHLKKKKNSFSLDRCTHMDQHYGKSSPMVANVGSKVYVISGAPYFQNKHTTLGSFEVYNLSDDYWGILNDASSYTSHSNNYGQILGHLVLGHKLLIKDDTGKAYFFETRLHTSWQELDKNALKSFLEVGLSLPTNGISVPFFQEFNNDFQLVISREGIEDANAMLIHAPTCSLKYYQSLKEIFKGRYPVTKNGHRIQFFGARNIFLLLPNNQICAIWVGFDQCKRLHLFITIFALELLGNPMVIMASSSSSNPFQHQETMFSKAQETAFIRTRIVHTFDCIVNDVVTPNYVFDAFFC